MPTRRRGRRSEQSPAAPLPLAACGSCQCSWATSTLTDAPPGVDVNTRRCRPRPTNRATIEALCQSGCPQTAALRARLGRRPAHYPPGTPTALCSVRSDGNSRDQWRGPTRGRRNENMLSCNILRCCNISVLCCSIAVLCCNCLHVRPKNQQQATSGGPRS